MPDLIHVRNPHDDGYDLATGQDVASGRVIGTLFWDTSGGAPGGWVLRIGAEDLLPDTTDEIVAFLAERGYELDDSSLAEIERVDRYMEEH